MVILLMACRAYPGAVKQTCRRWEAARPAPAMLLGASMTGAGHARFQAPSHLFCASQHAGEQVYTCGDLLRNAVTVSAGTQSPSHLIQDVGPLQGEGMRIVPCVCRYAGSRQRASPIPTQW